MHWGACIIPKFPLQHCTEPDIWHDLHSAENESPSMALYRKGWKCKYGVVQKLSNELIDLISKHHAKYRHAKPFYAWTTMKYWFWGIILKTNKVEDKLHMYSNVQSKLYILSLTYYVLKFPCTIKHFISDFQARMLQDLAWIWINFKSLKLYLSCFIGTQSS